MDRPELNEDFVDLIRALLATRVEFIIVGAHALAASGFPRATGVLDIFVNPSPENAALVMEALEMFGAPLAAHGISRTDFEIPNTVYQIGLPPRRIDTLTSISGVSFEEALASRLSIDLAGLVVPVMGKQALIKNKRAAGRPKDLIDADLLEEKKGNEPGRAAPCSRVKEARA